MQGAGMGWSSRRGPTPLLVNPIKMTANKFSGDPSRPWTFECIMPATFGGSIDEFQITNPASAHS